MWLGDFEEGPYVLYQDQPVRTHLSAFIDCHSRYLVTGGAATDQQSGHRCLLQAAVQNAARRDESLLQQTLAEFHFP